MILFVCSLGRLRSRTAELLCLFGGVDARSAGTTRHADQPVNDNLLQHAKLIVCMESQHHEALKGFQHYGQAPVLVLDIPDNYDRLQPELVTLLLGRIRQHRPELSTDMERGGHLIASQPGYRLALGTRSSPMAATNPAFGVFPQ